MAAAQAKTDSRASSPTTGRAPNAELGAPTAPFALKDPAGTGADNDSVKSVAASSINTKASGASATPNAVYRVQLEFKPSMEDELELHAGQLVRLLHEYDDGWVSDQSFF